MLVPENKYLLEQDCKKWGSFLVFLDFMLSAMIATGKDMEPWRLFTNLSASVTLNTNPSSQHSSPLTCDKSAQVAYIGHIKAVRQSVNYCESNDIYLIGSEAIDAAGSKIVENRP